MAPGQHQNAGNRQRRVDGDGSLDDLPLTPLRRYAKEPSQVYAIRIPASRLEAIRRLAERRDEQPTALLREWVLERLDDELDAAERVGETPAPYLAAPKIKGKRAASAIKPDSKAKTPKPKVARSRKR